MNHKYDSRDLVSQPFVRASVGRFSSDLSESSERDKIDGWVSRYESRPTIGLEGAHES